jgi:Tol biopolymer transport system component
MKIRVSIAAAGVAVAGSLAIGLAPAASAADRGANGLIAFSHAGSQIAVLGAGGAETILTPSGGNQAWPAFSPDGTRIAFVQSFHLWIMKANGGDAHAVPVTGDPYEGGPAWSPNATKLAYINGTDGQLYTVPVAGGTPTRITSGITEMADIRWSPDGTKIVFDAKDTTGTGYRQIFRVNLTTKAVTRLTSGTCDRWNRTGRRMAPISPSARPASTGPETSASSPPAGARPARSPSSRTPPLATPPGRRTGP